MSGQPCALCRGLFPPAQLVTVDGRTVCVGCKPLLLQRLLSGTPEPLLPLGFDARELGFLEMLGTSARVLLAEGLRILPLMIAISLLSSGVLALLPETDEATLPGVMEEVARVSGVGLLMGSIASLAIVWLVRERLEGRGTSFAGALALAGRRWLAAVGTGFLEGVIMLFLFLLLIVPGIIFTALYAFSLPIVALSGRSGMEALNYSWTLVKGRWWRVFLYTLGLLLPMFGVIFGAALVGALWPEFSYPEWVENLLLDLATLPALLGLTVLYLHLDAQHRARAAASEERLPERSQGMGGAEGPDSPPASSS